MHLTEITDGNEQVRKGCTVIKKGEVYESHLFTTKDERYKSEAFIAEAKEVYTELINSQQRVSPNKKDRQE